VRAPRNAEPLPWSAPGTEDRLPKHADSGTSPGRRRWLAQRVVVLGIGAATALTLVACHPIMSVTSTTRPPASLPATGGLPVSMDVLAGAVVGGRFIHPIFIGGLRVTPLAGTHRAAPLGLDLAEAKEYAALTGGLANGAPASGQQIVGYGSVTLSGVTPPTGTPVLRGRPAWIGIVLGSASTEGYNCPSEQATTPRAAGHSPSGLGARTYQPIDSAVIFYGMRGQGAVLYRTGGSKPCGGFTRPRVTVAYAEVPVPWAQLGSPGLATSIGYQAPACAQLFGVGTGGNVHTGIFSVSVTVVFPFDRTGCRAVKRFTTTATVFPVDPGPGAPPPATRVVLQQDPVPASIPPSLVGPIAG
jgi:hypothetical protein